MGEALGLLGLGALLTFVLAISWRRWPDPIIDFGRELYLPWRLSQGAVLYRDVTDIYGPLSQYVTAALFRVFGPGLMVLVAANFAVLLGILALIYTLLRRAWGAIAALLGTGLFIALFVASQYRDLGNFNYLTPYSEETTHGFFVCLTLVFVLVRWIDHGTRAGSFLAGFLFGLTFVLKPEITLAAGPLIITALLIRMRLGTPARWPDLALLALGTILPTAIFVAFFAVAMPLPGALNAACRGWLNLVTTRRFSNYNLEWYFVGLDDPWVNLRHEITGFLAAALLFSAIAAAAWFCDKITRRWLYLLTLGLLAAVVLALALHPIHWPRAAYCLPGLTLLYVIATTAQFFRRPATDTRLQLTRLLLAVLALALLARMILRARIYDYGYYQAALAVIILPNILLAEVPAWLKLGRRGATAFAVGLAALFLPGVVTLDAISYQHLRVKTVPVGTGADLFYASHFEPIGALVDSVSSALRDGPRNSTLVVLPEGVMINYLARLPSPVAPVTYYGASTTGGREDQIVADLQAHPPDIVVIISRPLWEYGVARYGMETGEGRQLIDWVKRNYVVAFARGGNPLDNTTCGVVVLTPRPGTDR